MPCTIPSPKNQWAAVPLAGLDPLRRYRPDSAGRDRSRHRAGRARSARRAPAPKLPARNHGVWTSVIVFPSLSAGRSSTVCPSGDDTVDVGATEVRSLGLDRGGDGDGQVRAAPVDVRRSPGRRAGHARRASRRCRGRRRWPGQCPSSRIVVSKIRALSTAVAGNSPIVDGAVPMSASGARHTARHSGRRELGRRRAGRRRAPRLDAPGPAVGRAGVGGRARRTSASTPRAC